MTVRELCAALRGLDDKQVVFQTPGVRLHLDSLQVARVLEPRSKREVTVVFMLTAKPPAKP